MAPVLVPAGHSREEIVVRKSRFIGLAGPVLSAGEARERVRAQRDDHPRARHVAWAFLVGDDAGLPGMSDDGEPRGTAGRPLMDVLRGSGLTNVLLMVIRYYGGIKLGTGGLSSAYSRAGMMAMEALPFREKINRVRGRIRLAYPVYEPVRQAADDCGALVMDTSFAGDVVLELAVPEDRLPAFLRTLRDLTRGQGRFEKETT